MMRNSFQCCQHHIKRFIIVVCDYLEGREELGGADIKVFIPTTNLEDDDQIAIKLDKASTARLTLPSMTIDTPIPMEAKAVVNGAINGPHGWQAEMMLADTGSVLSLMSLEFFYQLGFTDADLYPTNVVLSAANGQELPVQEYEVLCKSYKS